MSIESLHGPIAAKMKSRNVEASNLSNDLAQVFSREWLAGDWSKMKEIIAFYKDKAGNDAWKSHKVLVSRVTRSISYFGDKVVKNGESLPDMWLKADFTITVTQAYAAVPKKEDTRSKHEKLIKYILANGITEADCAKAFEAIGAAEEAYTENVDKALAVLVGAEAK